MASDDTLLIEQTLGEMAAELSVLNIDRLPYADRDQLQRAILYLADLVGFRGRTEPMIDKGQVARIYREHGHSKAHRKLGGP